MEFTKSEYGIKENLKWKVCFLIFCTKFTYYHKCIHFDVKKKQPINCIAD